MLKRFLQLLIAALIFNSLTANAENIKISTGENYQDHLFYSLANGASKSEPYDNWDIAFEIGQNAGILINGAIGNKVYYVPESNEDSWEMELDTNGMASEWPRYYNSPDSWNVGAFNMGLNGFETDGDFGWGAYNMATHAVSGKALFVVILSDGTAKRFMISQLISGKYEILIADIDGSDPEEFQIKKSDFTGKNFAYLSLKEMKTIDREPQSNSWDLLFGKYEAQISMGQSIVGYGVTGVKSNKQIKTAKMEDVDVETVEAPADGIYSESITAIGHDWKKFNLDDGIYELVENLAYFVMTAEGLIYKIVFTGFEGSTTGNIEFTQTQMPVSVIEYNNNKSSFSVYPNIISSGEELKLVHDMDSDIINYKIINTHGATLIGGHLSGNGNLSVGGINTTGLSAGSYFLIININGNVSFAKFVVVN